MNWRSQKQTSLLTYAIVLFFIFDGIALGLNIWLTTRVESQTVELNLAGRQRMLSQKMVKEFLYAPPGATSQVKLNNLNQTASLFDRTLAAFRQGGTTLNTDGTLVSVSAFNQQDYYPLVEEAWQTWQPMRSIIFDYINSPSPAQFISLNNEFSSNSNLLLDQMNRLTLAIETQTREETSQIRLFQIIALALGMLNFIAAYWLYRHRIQLLEKEHSLIDSLLFQMPSAMGFSDENGYLLQANPRFIDLLGISIEEAQKYKIQDLIIPHPTQEKCWQLSSYAFNKALLKVECTTAFESGRQLTIWRLEDISHAWQEKERLSDLAFRDPLTGLENRTAFEARLKEIVTDIEHSDLKHALMFLDLNGFKQVNDHFGHNMGDEILREVGRRLNAAMQSECYVARYGGDEFTLLLRHLKEEDSPRKFAEMILDELSKEYVINDNSLELTATIGIVVFQSNHQNGLTLLEQADQAMYRAKTKQVAPQIEMIRC